MNKYLLCAAVVLATCLSANLASAERKYFLEGLEITIPDTWFDIDSQKDFLKDKEKIAQYTTFQGEERLPLVRILEVAAPGNERGMLTFSIKPCYRGECPPKEQLQRLSQSGKTQQKNKQLITNDGSKLIKDYGMSVKQGCGGYFVLRGQKVKTPFGGIFISKSKMFYKKTTPSAPQSAMRATPPPRLSNGLKPHCIAFPVSASFVKTISGKRCRKTIPESKPTMAPA